MSTDALSIALSLLQAYITAISCNLLPFVSMPCQDSLLILVATNNTKSSLIKRSPVSCTSPPVYFPTTDHSSTRLHQESDESEIARNVPKPHRTLDGALSNDPKSLPEAIELGTIPGNATISSPSESDQGEAEDGNEPTELERRDLRHIGESLPYAAWLVAFVELCERFTFYGCQGLFQVRVPMSP